MSFTCQPVAVELQLSNGGFALIDEADLVKVQGRRWFGIPRGRNRYAGSYLNGKQVLLHRHLLDITARDLVVDHINFDGLDNRRANLRAVSVLENGRRKRKPISSKSSRFKGVTHIRGTRRWRAVIRVGDRRHHLGMYASPSKAAAAYNRVARRVFGPLALLNELPRDFT